MLEPPAIPLERLTARLLADYGLPAQALVFLPLGADVHTAVYRLAVPSGEAYFVKLRGRTFDEVSVTLPAYLHAQGLREIIPPLPNRQGRLWSELDDYALVVYPFIEGQDGYALALSEAQWVAFGAAVKRLHAAQLPAGLLHRIPREAYDPRWRNWVKSFQAQVEQETFDEPIAAQTAAFMRQQSGLISRLVSRAERLAAELQSLPQDLVLCHSDLHAGNLHLSAGGGLYIVDWDDPILAPKEHDLMHIGATARWTGRRIKSLFYRGYGAAQLDGRALTYYRCERIIRDIAEFCKQLLATSQGGSDRAQSLAYLTGQFEPGHEVEIATRTGGEADFRMYFCFSSKTL